LAGGVRSSYRRDNYPGSGGDSFGFRLVRPDSSAASASTTIKIEIADINEPEPLTEQTVRLNVGETKIFELSEYYRENNTDIKWYLNGSLVGTNPSYTFVKTTAGVYEVSVIVTNGADKSSGSCQVIVR